MQHLTSLAALLAVGFAGSADVETQVVQQPAIIHSDTTLMYRTDRTYSTATAVIPRVYGSSSPDSIPGRYRYTYTLVNEPSSTNSIWEFVLNPVPRPISVTPPPHWFYDYGYEGEDKALSFGSGEGDTLPMPADWDSVSMVPSIYDLQPGDSVTFRYVSDRAPSMTRFFVQGYYRDSISSDETNGRSFRSFPPVSIWNNSVSGAVIGPGTTNACTSTRRLGGGRP
jgi:hypothetical protein